MDLILIVLIVLLLAGGGWGCLGGWGIGPSVLEVILVVILILYILGPIRRP